MQDWYVSTSSIFFRPAIIPMAMIAPINAPHVSPWRATPPASELPAMKADSFPIRSLSCKLASTDWVQPMYFMSYWIACSSISWINFSLSSSIPFSSIFTLHKAVVCTFNSLDYCVNGNAVKEKNILLFTRFTLLRQTWSMKQDNNTHLTVWLWVGANVSELACRQKEHRKIIIVCQLQNRWVIGWLESLFDMRWILYYLKEISEIKVFEIYTATIEAGFKIMAIQSPRLSCLCAVLNMQSVGRISTYWMHGKVGNNDSWNSII